VELSVPLRDGLALKIADQPAVGAYPTARLQKGLVLLHDGRDLAEEGVGFGVPMLKRGAQTIFPGGVRLSDRQEGASRVITATYQVDLVERLTGSQGRGPSSGRFYVARDLLAALHRRAPALRGPLTAVSNTVRRACGWVTTFEASSSGATLAVTYSIDAADARLRIAVDATGLRENGITEVVVMNELGARQFDQYIDTDGARLRGRKIGTWDEVRAAGAAFAGTISPVAFSVQRRDGARLYRGRELVGSRLAWSGFGYSLLPDTDRFVYDVRIETAP
jgi:hypothetical protein